jgi:hypothetical protein
MTAYNGIMTDTDHLPDATLLLDANAFHIPLQFSTRPNSIDLEASLWRYDSSEAWVAAEDTEVITLTPSAYGGIRPHSFGDDNIFWRIWFNPVLIAVGLITEDSSYVINIWNAFLDSTVNITSVAESNPIGLDFTVPATPVTIQKFGEDYYTVTILKLGPPTQNSKISFTINGVVYETEITGIRVIPFVYDPDYKSRLEHTLEFETVISRAKRLKEQRRPLRENMLVHTDVEVFVQDIFAQHFDNTMRYGKGFVFGVPVYFEQIYPTSALTGQSTFTVSNDLTKLWMLNKKAQYIILINNSTLAGEIKEISSVAAGSITLVNAIQETFDLSDVAVYPAIFSYIISLSLSQKTDSFAVNRVGFKEFTVGR